MDTAARTYVIIAVEVTIFALLVTLVAFGSRFAGQLMTVREQHYAAEDGITEYRAMFKYSKGIYIEADDTNAANLYTNYALKSNTDLSKIANVVYGDDIIHFLYDYEKKLNVYILTDKPNGKTELKQLSTTVWNISAVASSLGEDISREYYMVLAYNPIWERYTDVLFRIKQ